MEKRKVLEMRKTAAILLAFLLAVCFTVNIPMIGMSEVYADEAVKASEIAANAASVANGESASFVGYDVYKTSEGGIELRLTGDIVLNMDQGLSLYAIRTDGYYAPFGGEPRSLTIKGNGGPLSVGVGNDPGSSVKVENLTVDGAAVTVSDTSLTGGISIGRDLYVNSGSLAVSTKASTGIQTYVGFFSGGTVTVEGDESTVTGISILPGGGLVVSGGEVNVSSAQIALSSDHFEIRSGKVTAEGSSIGIKGGLIEIEKLATVIATGTNDYPIYSEKGWMGIIIQEPLKITSPEGAGLSSDGCYIATVPGGDEAVKGTVVIEAVETEQPLVRIAGANRYETALRAGAHLRRIDPDLFPNVIIASGTAFPDALAGSYLAWEAEAPILLADSARANEVAKYVDGNLENGGKVFILGGEGAVPGDMEAALVRWGIPEDNIIRLKGSNRYLTNIEILRACSSEGYGNVLVCSGKEFADALSASALGGPILLVGDRLTTDQKAYIDEAGIHSFDIIGGTAAVSKAVEDELRVYAEARGGEVTRTYGQNRYQTSRAVAEKWWSPESTDTVVLACGTNFPDGLSGAPVAFAYRAPLLLATTSGIKEAAECGKWLGISKVVVMGGPTLISDDAAMKTIR